MNRYITLLTLSENFPDEESYIRYFEKMRWGDKVISPYDKLLRSSVNGKYKYKNTKKSFDVKTGTSLQHEVTYGVCFYAMMLCLSHKRGISSCQLTKDLKLRRRVCRKCFIKLDKIWEWRIITPYQVRLKLMKCLWVEKTRTDIRTRK